MALLVRTNIPINYGIQFRGIFSQPGSGSENYEKKIKIKEKYQNARNRKIIRRSDLGDP